MVLMDCSENQYRYNGGCHPCLLCGPGLELSEDCGYGGGRLAYCVPCSVKTYKDIRDYHDCRFCQSCKHLNRRQKSPCNSRRNAECGECLPGFYSKARVDGLQDLECMPCSPSSSSTAKQPCGRIGEVDVEVWNPESPTSDVAVVTTICVCLVTMAVVLSVVMLTYFRHTLLRKIFKGCLALRSTSQGDMEMATSTVSRVMLTPEQEGRSAADSSSRQSSSVKMFTLPGPSVSINPDPRPLDRSQILETQSLVRNSTCSHCPPGFVSQVSSEPPSPSDGGDNTVEPTAFPLHGGESTAGSWQGTEDYYCASERRQQSHQHVPVECTELDLHSMTMITSGSDVHCPVHPLYSSMSLGTAPVSERRDGTSVKLVNGTTVEDDTRPGVWRMELTGVGAGPTTVLPQQQSWKQSHDGRNTEDVYQSHARCSSRKAATGPGGVTGF